MQGYNKNGFRLFTSAQNIFIFATLAQVSVANVCFRLFLFILREIKFTMI